MNTGDRKKRRFFTAADVLITVVVLALAAGAAAMFLFPREEKTTAVPVEVTMLIHLPEAPDGIAVGDRLFSGGRGIGSVSRIDKSSNNVVIDADIEKDDGAYLLFGEPVRVNGAFVLETRLRRVEGVVESIDEKGTAGDE